jgi:uncharacterized HAD superfamily protein
MTYKGNLLKTGMSTSKTLERIGVDLDGVLGDLVGVMIKEAYNFFGVSINEGEITSFKLEDCTDLTEDQIREIFKRREIYERISIIPDSQFSINRFRENGFIIHVITDRRPELSDITRKWLDANGFHWDYLHLIKADDKAKLAKRNDISIFIEDKYETVLDLSGVCRRVYLINRPYNQGKLPRNVFRVNTWSEIVGEIIDKPAINNYKSIKVHP